MPKSPVYRPRLHAYALALSACTFLLLFVGGMVTSTNSGLSVPDWPTTFGRNMFMFPPSMMKGGIFYEHGHRLFASAVGLLTIGICAGLWLRDNRRALKWAGSAALLLVIVQGVLGGLTVKFKLPVAVSAAHACVAELFFALTVFIAFATSKSWIEAGSARFRWSAAQALSLLFTALVFVQILVGAVMRHSYAGLAIPTFPSAFGAAVPPFWNFGIAVNFLHTRVGAGLVTALGALVIGVVFVSKFLPGRVKALAALLGLAILLQCLLGMFTVWSGKAPVPTTLHLSGGAFVFATGFLLFLAVYRLPGTQAAQRRARAGLESAKPNPVTGGVALS